MASRKQTTGAATSALLEPAKMPPAMASVEIRQRRIFDLVTEECLRDSVFRRKLADHIRRLINTTAKGGTPPIPWAEFEQAKVTVELVDRYWDENIRTKRLKKSKTRIHEVAGEILGIGGKAVAYRVKNRK